MSRERRQGMVETDHPRLSITRQCQVLGLARSTWYHRPQGEKAVNLDLMRLIDAQFLEAPFYGSRQMQRKRSIRRVLSERAGNGRSSGRDDQGAGIEMLGQEGLALGIGSCRRQVLEEVA